VTDYLLKPISFDRFLKAINKVYDRMQNEVTIPSEKQVATNPSDTAVKDYFFVKTETHIEKVTASDVLYVEGMGDYWRIVTQKKRIMTLMNAHGIEDVLPDNQFCRVHRSYFVAISKIESIERKHIKIADQRIPIGDTYQKKFFDIIEKKK
jgi:DNA-binding LytR/AlgR family response regulator